nr:MAG TPA: YfbU domain protein [Caudoviricetes sp.]
MELSRKDRIILFNQYEILKRLDTDSAEQYEIYQDILAQGFEYEYDDIGPSLFEVPQSVSEKVYEILGMFRRMVFSFDNLEDVTGLDREDYMFRGFDGNEETEHYVYAKWLVKNNHKFGEFENCEFNSHWNILPRYEEMLERFYEVTKDKEKGIYSTNLSADELNYIIDKK